MNEQYILKSENRVWKILTALYGNFRKHSALQTAEKKQRYSEKSLWLWVVKYPLLNGDKPGLGIDREWSRDDCEAIGSDGRPWVAAEWPEMAENGKSENKLVGAAPVVVGGRKWVG